MSKKKCNFGKVLCIGLIAAVVAALVAAWKASKPVEDPWHVPAPSIDPQPPVVDNSRTADAQEIRDLASE